MNKLNTSGSIGHLPAKINPTAIYTKMVESASTKAHNNAHVLKSRHKYFDCILSDCLLKNNSLNCDSFKLKKKN